MIPSVSPNPTLFFSHDRWEDVSVYHNITCISPPFLPPQLAYFPLTSSPFKRLIANLFPRLGRISEESVEFFERVNAVLQKQENMLRAAQAEVTHAPNLPPFHLLHIWSMFVKLEGLSAVIQPAVVADVTFVDRRAGVSRALRRLGAQLWQAAVGGGVQLLLLIPLTRQRCCVNISAESYWCPSVQIAVRRGRKKESSLKHVVETRRHNAIFPELKSPALYSLLWTSTFGTSPLNSAYEVAMKAAAMEIYFTTFNHHFQMSVINKKNHCCIIITVCVSSVMRF